MIKALCFKCGAKKKEPAGLCDRCMAAPRKYDDLVLSYCLSTECIKPETLVKCGEYLTEKKRLPKFHSSVVAEANRLAARHAGPGEQSMEFSQSMLEFADSEEDLTDVPRRRTVLVNVIGRRAGHSDEDPSTGLGSRQKTCHSETWIVGKHISEEQVNEYLDGNQIFVWYRWIHDRWSWSCISRGKFAQLKAVEDGNPF
jgi:hypothetical protein